MSREPKAGLSLKAFLRYCRWETRGSASRWAYWILCLAVGVGAVVSISGLADSLDSAIRREARSLLAADLAVRSRGAPGEELDAALDQIAGAERLLVREMMSVVARRAREGDQGRGRSQLSEIKAVGDGYPFFGELEIEGSDATGPIEEILTEDQVLVDSQILSRLGLEVGDKLFVGRAELEIAGVLLSEPDRMPAQMEIGPRVLVRSAAYDRARLVPMAGFARYATLVRLPEPSDRLVLDATTERLRTALADQPSYSVESYADAQPQIRRDLDRLEGFLGLVALLSLLIGGVGVAQGVRTWISAKLDSIAILKCLGVRPRELFVLYLTQATALGVVASLLGSVLGLLGLLLVPAILGNLLPEEAISPWQPGALLRGVLLGTGLCVAFSLAPLLTVLRVPPLRALRRSAEPLKSSGRLQAGVLVALVLAVGSIAALQSGSFRIAGLFLIGVLATAAALTVASWLLAQGANRLARGRQRVWLRYGLSSLARPGAPTLSSTVAMGLGLLVLTTMTLVQGHLTDQLEADLPKDAPSAFLLDVRGDQWEPLSGLLEQEGAEQVRSVPLLLGKLHSIDGKGLAELREEGVSRWALRFQRLTQLAELPSDNQLVAGRWFEDDGVPEVSVELDFAEELGLQIGGTMELEVDGQIQELRVSNFREVNWEGFGINFFVAIEPGAYGAEEPPRLASAQLPVDREQEIQDLIAEDFANVVVIRIRQMIDKVMDLVGRLQTGVRLLGSFAVLASLAILAGAVASSSAQRGREVAVLKTLGMTRFDILRTFAAEYALVGGLAGVIACAGSTLLAWLVITRALEIPWELRAEVLARTLGLGVALSVSIGLLASLGALRSRPVESLRER